MRKLARSEAREEIKKLNRIDPKIASYTAILSSFRKIAHGMRTTIGLAGGGELFYRARISSTKLRNVAELHAPPPELVLGYQRCNPPHTPMFYSASKRVGALLETRISEGDIVYLSQWIARNQIPVNRIFDTEENQAVEGEYGSTLSGPNDDLLLAYLDTQFTRRIHENFADDYKFTAAFAQFLTSNFSENDEQHIGPDGYVALKYPSVLGLVDWHNTAMHADFAKERLELLHTMEVKIISVNEKSVKVDILDTATIFESGVINWSSNPNLVPALLEQNRAVRFVHDGTSWNLNLRDGLITAEYLDALMTE